MSWEAYQPQAVMARARNAKRRERDATMNDGALKPRLTTDDSWKRPAEPFRGSPPPEALLNRQELLLLEIRDAIRGNELLLVEIRDAIRELTAALTKRPSTKRRSKR